MYKAKPINLKLIRSSRKNIVEKTEELKGFFYLWICKNVSFQWIASMKLEYGGCHAKRTKNRTNSTFGNRPRCNDWISMNRFINPTKGPLRLIFEWRPLKNPVTYIWGRTINNNRMQEVKIFAISNARDWQITNISKVRGNNRSVVTYKSKIMIWIDFHYNILLIIDINIIYAYMKHI